MPDPDAAIRARLDEFCGDWCADEGKAALLAVLDLHKLETEHSWEIYRASWMPERAPSPPLCSQCSAGQEHQVPWPCPTVRAIAEALGIEVV